MSKGTNCGLLALEQMATLKSVSMFTLIHLAKDNGLNLYFCKVEPEELAQVTRPAIFHQKDHFIFVEDGKPMPAGEYDGYVLTPKPLHEPLPYSLAKKIRGKKNASGFLGPVLTGVASIINPVLGAVVGAGTGAWQASQQPGGISKNWWQIPVGGASGFVQGGGLSGFGSSWAAGGNAASALNAGILAAGQVPNAIKTGNWMAPVAAGVGGYMGAKFVGGAQSGLASAQQAGQNIFGQIGGAFKGGISTMTGAQKLSSGAPGSGGIEIAKGAVGTTPAGYSGTYTVPGIGNKVVGIPGMAGPVGFSSGASNLAGGLSMTATPGTAGGKNILSQLVSNGGMGIPGMSNTQLLGMGLSALMPQPKLEGDVMSNYSKAAQYLGGDNWNQLPTATRQQLQEYVSMPLDQLATKFYAPDDKGMRMLEEKHQQEKDSLMSMYANYGQDPYTSTEAQQKLTELNRQYDQAKAEYQQQLQNQAMNQAIQFKQQMLQNAMNQGQFDYNSAMELATYIGRDQELKYAMESKNYEMLQNVLAEIFSIGNVSK